MPDEGDVQKRIREYNGLADTDSGRAILLAMAMDHLGERLEANTKTLGDKMETLNKRLDGFNKEEMLQRLAVIEERANTSSKIVYGLCGALALEVLAIAFTYFKA